VGKFPAVNLVACGVGAGCSYFEAVCNDGSVSQPTISLGGPSLPGTADDDRDLVDAFIGASRALVAVAARSLADLGEEVTLPQYRALVVLRTRGSQRAADLAGFLDVTPSTASRMIERLVRKRLVRRARSKDDRRTVRVHLTASGEEVVVQVTDRRRAEIERILAQMPVRGRRALTAALRAFADAAGEAPEQDWALGWDE
jgi:DNA-binding MarR family transcriptional regulator